MEFLDDQKILYSKQFGFQNFFSASHAIISIIESIQEIVEDKQIACGVFINLEKAFDTVNHTLLLNKLSYYFRSIANRSGKFYLSDHAQYFTINGFNSNHNRVQLNFLKCCHENIVTNLSFSNLMLVLKKNLF